MGRKIDPDKKQLAYMLFMQGELQKVIAERLDIHEMTISKWVAEEKWKEKKAANTVTRSELVNKTLGKISELLDHVTEGNDENKAGIADQLSKMVASLTKLDKQNSVIDDMDTFMSFNTWLKKRMELDKELSIDTYKAINKYQDLYVHERLSNK